MSEIIGTRIQAIRGFAPSIQWVEDILHKTGVRQGGLV